MNKKIILILIGLWLLLITLLLVKFHGSMLSMPNNGSVKGWTAVSGRWSAITSTKGAYHSVSGNPTSYLIKEDSSQRNSIAEVNARINTRESDKGRAHLLGITVRYTDAGNNYYLAFMSQNKVGGRLTGELQAVKNYGSEKVVLKRKAFTMECGRYYRFTGIASGNRIELLVDGNPELSFMDDTLAYGDIGLVSGDCNCDFSNFSIEETTGRERPDSYNTGPIYPHNVVQSDSLTITKDDTVIENISVNGAIHIKANNVVIRNFVVTSDRKDCFSIQIEEGYSGIVLEDGEIDGADFILAGVSGSNYTASRLNIHNSGGSGLVAGSNSIIKECWLHSLGMAAGSSAVGISTSSGTNIRIVGNNIDVPFDAKGSCGSAIFISPDFGDIKDVVIDRNWVNGGNYSIYSIDFIKDSKVIHTATGIQITNNRFGKDYRYGIKEINNSTLWTGNEWESGGSIP